MTLCPLRKTLPPLCPMSMLTLLRSTGEIHGYAFAFANLFTSSFIYCHFEDLDEEEDRKERTLMTGAKSSTTTTDVLHHRALPNSSTPAHHSQDRSAKTTVHDSLSNGSSSTTSASRQDKSATSDTTVLHEQTLPITSDQPGCTCDSSAEVCLPDQLDEGSLPLSLGHPQGFASTVVTNELDQDDLCHCSNDINVLLNHTLPKSRSRRLMMSPRGRLFGTHTT